MDAVREYVIASGGLSSGEDQAYTRFERASQMMDASNGWEVESYATQVGLPLKLR
jgi:hypothetical protein